MADNISQLNFSMPASQATLSTISKKNTSVTVAPKAQMEAINSKGPNAGLMYKIGLSNTIEQGFKGVLTLDKNEKAFTAGKNTAAASNNTKASQAAMPSTPKNVYLKSLSDASQNVSEKSKAQTSVSKRNVDARQLHADAKAIVTSNKTKTAGIKSTNRQPDIRGTSIDGKSVIDELRNKGKTQENSGTRGPVDNTRTPDTRGPGTRGPVDNTRTPDTRGPGTRGPVDNTRTPDTRGPGTRGPVDNTRTPDTRGPGTRGPVDNTKTPDTRGPVIDGKSVIDEMRNKGKNQENSGARGPAENTKTPDTRGPGTRGPIIDGKSVIDELRNKGKTQENSGTRGPAENTRTPDTRGPGTKGPLVDGPGRSKVIDGQNQQTPSSVAVNKTGNPWANKNIPQSKPSVSAGTMDSKPMPLTAGTSQNGKNAASIITGNNSPLAVGNNTNILKSGKIAGSNDTFVLPSPKTIIQDEEKKTKNTESFVTGRLSSSIQGDFSKMSVKRKDAAEDFKQWAQVDLAKKGTSGKDSALSALKNRMSKYSSQIPQSFATKIESRLNQVAEKVINEKEKQILEQQNKSEEKNDVKSYRTQISPENKSSESLSNAAKDFRTKPETMPADENATYDMPVELNHKKNTAQAAAVNKQQQQQVLQQHNNSEQVKTVIYKENIEKADAQKGENITKHEDSVKFMDQNMQRAALEAAVRSDDLTRTIQKKKEESDSAKEQYNGEKDNYGNLDYAKKERGQSNFNSNQNNAKFAPEQRNRTANDFSTNHEQSKLTATDENLKRADTNPDIRQTKQMQTQTQNNAQTNTFTAAQTQEMLKKEDLSGKSQWSKVTRDAQINQMHTSATVQARNTQEAVKHANTSIESIIKKSNVDLWTGDEIAAKLIYLLMKSASEYTYEHSNRVIDLTTELAQEMGIKDPQFLKELKEGAMFHDIGEVELDLENAPPAVQKKLADFLGTEEIKNSGFLHDIGKVRIPDEILYKSSRLTDEEFAIMKQHPVIGEEILKGIPGLAHVLPVVRHHHERWDGKGYPDGISGENIPFAARIVALCDSFDAMVSDRPYRQGMPLDSAIAEIRKGAGTQFDPLMAETFIRLVEKKYKY